MTAGDLGLFLAMGLVLSLTTSIAVGFAALWLHERKAHEQELANLRQMLDQDMGWRVIEAASTRLNGAYARREVQKLQELAEKGLRQ